MEDPYCCSSSVTGRHTSLTRLPPWQQHLSSQFLSYKCAPFSVFLLLSMTSLSGTQKMEYRRRITMKLNMGRHQAYESPRHKAYCCRDRMKWQGLWFNQRYFELCWIIKKKNEAPSLQIASFHHVFVHEIMLYTVHLKYFIILFVTHQ